MKSTKSVAFLDAVCPIVTILLMPRGRRQNKEDASQVEVGMPPVKTEKHADGAIRIYFRFPILEQVAKLPGRGIVKSQEDRPGTSGYGDVSIDVIRHPNRAVS